MSGMPEAGTLRVLPTVTVRLDQDDLHELQEALVRHEVHCDAIGFVQHATRTRTLLIKMREALRGLA